MMKVQLPESALAQAASLPPGVLPPKCRELDAWHDEWSLETCLSYIGMLCTALPEKCMPKSPIWAIMEFVGSTPWWILCKIFQSNPSAIGHFWSNDCSVVTKEGVEKEPARLYRVTTNYLATILRSRPDFCHLPPYDDPSSSVRHEDIHFMLKYCKIHERAVQVSFNHSRQGINDYNDNIRFLHFDFCQEKQDNKFANDVLNVTPRLIVVSLPCYWNNLDIPVYVNNIHIFMKTAPIVFINIHREFMSKTIKTQILYKFVRRLFAQQPPKSILIVRSMDQRHTNRPFLKLLVDEPLRKYMYYNIFS
jgi:hypothetical protein